MGPGLRETQVWRDETKQGGNGQATHVVNEYCCCAHNCAALGEANPRSDEVGQKLLEIRIGEEMREGKEYEVARIGKEDTCSDAGVGRSTEEGQGTTSFDSTVPLSDTS